MRTNCSACWSSIIACSPSSTSRPISLAAGVDISCVRVLNVKSYRAPEGSDQTPATIPLGRPLSFSLCLCGEFFHVPTIVSSVPSAMWCSKGRLKAKVLRCEE